MRLNCEDSTNGRGVDAVDARYATFLIVVYIIVKFIKNKLYYLLLQGWS